MNRPIAVIHISTKSCLSTQPDVRVDVKDDVKDGVKDHVRVENPCFKLSN